MWATGWHSPNSSQLAEHSPSWLRMVTNKPLRFFPKSMSTPQTLPLLAKHAPNSSQASSSSSSSSSSRSPQSRWALPRLFPNWLGTHQTLPKLLFCRSELFWLTNQSSRQGRSSFITQKRCFSPWWLHHITVFLVLMISQKFVFHLFNWVPGGLETESHHTQTISEASRPSCFLDFSVMTLEKTRIFVFLFWGLWSQF